MRELDNIRIMDLGLILNHGTALKRYSPIIAAKEPLVQTLLQNNIADKYAFLASSPEELSKITGIPPETLELLGRFLRSYDYRSRKLSEIACAAPALLQHLAAGGIKDSLAYIRLCKSSSPAAVARQYGAAPDDAAHLFSLCDLMRLPGVKSVRGNLYCRCGYRSIKAFAGRDAEAVRNSIGQKIAENGWTESVPFLKELKTQIAAAAVLPAITEEWT